MFSLKTWSTFLVAVFFINYCTGASVSIEQAAKDDLNSYDIKISKIHNNITEASIQDNKDDISKFEEELSQTLNELRRDINKYAGNNFTDEILRRQIKKIVDSQYYLQPEEKSHISRIQKHFNELSNKTDNCKYEDRSICNLTYVPQVKSIFARSHDPKELEYYWEQWRDKHWLYATNNYRIFINIIQKLKPVSGVSVLSHGWFSRFEGSHFIREMERVMSELSEFYKEFHAYVRHVLNRKYGDFTVSKTGPIPEHLLEQILEQAWDEDSLLEAPFPDKNLPNLKAGLKGHSYDANKIARISAQFYNSIGFTPFNESFWNSLVTPKKPEEVGEDCNPEINPITVQIKYCPKSNFKQFLQLHGYIAMAEYKILARSQPFGLRDEVCPGFSNAIGEAVILSASTPKHIERVDILTDYHYDDQLSLNRLFRLGIHTMFQIPSYFVHDKFIIDTFNDLFDWSRINCHYWALMNQFAGVEPPLNRSKNSLDVPYKFYRDISENHQTKKFISEVLGYQIYRGLCEKSGQYVPNDPLRPLQNCDFYDSIAVGNILKEAMSLGQSQPWYAVLKKITGEETISAGGLLEFYKPLLVWLKAQNRLNNVKVGWTRSTKCF